MSRIEFSSGEQVLILVVIGLLIVGGGFRLFCGNDGLQLEVEPLIRAEASPGKTAGQSTGTEQTVVGAAEAAANPSPAPAPGQASPTAVPGQVNINTASALELTALPGVGPVLAQRIIDYRTEHGPFFDGRQLVEVKGIGEKTLARMLPFVLVKDEEESAD